MTNDPSLDTAANAIVQRARDRFEHHVQRTRVGIDRFFVKFFVGEWLFALLLAVVVSPTAWAGKTSTVNPHVWAALLLGGAIVSLPIALALKRPGDALTRHVIAAAQMLFSGLLIHLTGGRIETHFHVFGSLAILAFYLDWPVLVTATVVVAAHHFALGLLWPESVYGITNPAWWRFLEHAFWVVFCVSFLTASCRRQLRDWLSFAEEGGLIEALAEQEWRRTSVLERAPAEPRPAPSGTDE